MHCKVYCPHCNKEFLYRNMLTRHLVDCDGAMSTQPSSSPAPAPVPVPVNPPAPPTSAPSLTDLAGQIEQLSSKLDTIAATGLQTVHNVNSNNVVNIQIIGQDFYQELCTRMGTHQAIDFLTNSAASNKPLDVIRRLYLDNIQPAHYPIAFHNGSYRYINDQHKLVEDKTGQIAKTITSNIQEAMLKATNDLINQSMQQSKTDQLYDFYDLGVIQHNLSLFTNPTMVDQIADSLSKLVSNQNHFLFQAEPEMIIE